MLKTSARNSAEIRSVNFCVLDTEVSRFQYPGPRKGFFTAFPKVFKAGGVITALPWAQDPNACSVAIEAARAVQRGVLIARPAATIAAPVLWLMPAGAVVPATKNPGLFWLV